MHCSVQDCSSTNEGFGNDITFHIFPNDPTQYKSWMKALSISEWELGEHSRVCSKHFLDEDFYLTNSGQRCIRNGAVPFVMKVSGDDDDAPAKYRVCRICLAIDTDMYNIRENALFEAYQHITGLKIEEDSLPQKVCCKCAEHLTASYQFRNKALLANHRLLQALQENTYISVGDIKSINSLESTFNPSISLELSNIENNGHKIGYDKSQKVDIDVKLNKHVNIKRDIEENFKPEIKSAVKRKGAVAETEIHTKSKKITKVEKHENNDNMKTGNSDITGVDGVNANEDAPTIEVKNKEEHTYIYKYLEQFCDILYSDEESNIHELDELHGLDASMSETKLTVEKEIEKIKRRKETDKYKDAKYKCDKCYKGFQLKKYYERHMKRHSDLSGPYECDICKLRMKTKIARTTHLKRSHGQKYTCSKCGFETTDREKAKSHIRWHQGAKYECSICHIVFQQSTTLHNHLRKKHKASVICELCGHSFVNDRGLILHKNLVHIRAYTEELVGPYCEICDVKFLDEVAHATHLRLSLRHSSDNTRAAETKRCNKPQNSTETPELLSCELCGVQLGSVYSYAQHFRRRHAGETRRKHRGRQRTPTRFICDQCGKSFHGITLLNDHMGVHSGLKNHPCDQCEKSFATYSRLHKHKKMHEENRPTHVCPECGQLFTTSSGLGRHKRSKHCGKKSFKCDDCDKSYSSAEGLRAHIDHVHLKKPWPMRKGRERKRRHTGNVKKDKDTMED